jgi:hypothetical protein
MTFKASQNSQWRSAIGVINVYTIITVHIHIGTLFAESAQTVPSLHMQRSFSAKNKPAMVNNPVKFHCNKERRYDT